MNKRIFIFGAGFSGRAIGEALAPEAEFIGGTTRDPDKAGGLSALKIEPFFYTGDGLSDELHETLRTITHLIVSIAPGEGGDPVLADIDTPAVLPALEWIGYLSTVGVYGDHGCAWVDEESPCRPASARSRRRIDAEKNWAGFGRRADVPVALLRLAGIYGPGRNPFVNLAKGTARRIVKPGQVFNRIHVADIAGAMRHLLHQKAAGIFNLVDDEPSPSHEVVAYAASLLGVAPPPEIPFEEAELGPMARSFYSECKRVSNARLKASGYSLQFSNYREALTAMRATEGTVLG
ncbi:SDR family oxidoreductase [Chelativorans sp. YIM 93263]|uniref:SDR family oxidoreductase n=1 Tax=Chelativorans sp. YIM 93263 TaxID=2906648 RepID=UPI002378E7D3|nr:SDR family oxidoreductase [Chelativorans sp. YIM 93263]